MEAKIIKTESLTIDGIDIDVQTVEVGTQEFRIGQLSVAQIQQIIGGGAAASSGFTPTIETIAQSIQEALPSDKRGDTDFTTAVAKLRLPALKALHSAVLELSGLTVSKPGENAAAAAQ